MDHLSFKTTHVSKANAQKSWVIVDASVAPLGRVCSQIANILRGKHKPSFTPNADCGDNVIVLNADNLRVTGKKMTEKVYITHSGYPGGQKRRTVREQMNRDSTRVIEHAVKGMLQGNKLGSAQYRNLYVYAGMEHPHEAQQPVAIELKNLSSGSSSSRMDGLPMSARAIDNICCSPPDSSLPKFFFLSARCGKSA